MVTHPNHTGIIALWDPTHVSNRLYLSRFTNNGAITYNKIPNLYSLIYWYNHLTLNVPYKHCTNCIKIMQQEIYFLTFKTKKKICSHYSASFIHLLCYYNVYYLPRKTRRQLLLWVLSRKAVFHVRLFVMRCKSAFNRLLLCHVVQFDLKVCFML